ncbi:hypothetical protein BGZ72_000464 [Mortierella alpina]|nr:hypothetical protein BGZ72_000464 [Mortierella alpina]
MPSRPDDQGRACDRIPPPLPTYTSTDQYALSNVISTDGLQMHALCLETNKPHRSQTSLTLLHWIERCFLDLQSTLVEFDVESVKDINVWSIDPGEVNPAAFCRLERQGSTGIATNSSRDNVGRAEHEVNIQILPPTIVARNLVVDRLAVYVLPSPLDAIKQYRPIFVPQENIENLVRPHQYEFQEDCETANSEDGPGWSSPTRLYASQSDSKSELRATDV